MDLPYNTAHRNVPLFYLIRHAETDLNASRTIQWPQTPLNPQGRWQANRVAAAPVSIDVRLRERHFGRLRGTSWPPSWHQFDSDDLEPLGGESQPVFRKRITAAWKPLEENIGQAEGSITIVTHGLVCRTLAHNDLTWTEQSDPPRFSNTSITVIGGATPWHVIQGPTDDHLKEDYQHATLRTHCP